MCANARLVLGCGALDRLATLLRLARSALLCGQSAVAAFGRNRWANLRDEGTGQRTGNEAAQVGHRAASHALGLQAARELVQQLLRLPAAGTQQHARCRAFLRQHLLWKYQITTTTGSGSDTGTGNGTGNGTGVEAGSGVGCPVIP